MTKNSEYILRTQNWIERFVLGLQLCPFAKDPFLKNKIRYFVLLEDDLQHIAQGILNLKDELIENDDIETTFVITPKVSLGFEEFYQLVSGLQHHIEQVDSSGIVLVAFHPDFRYHGSEPDDIANKTNQSPYPMVHLLRQESLDTAQNSDIHIGNLLQRNQDFLRSMTLNEINDLIEE